jgi:hypothetical protein
MGVTSIRTVTARAAASFRARARQALELHFRVVGERHGARDRTVSRRLGDQRVHALADAAIGGMPLRRGPQLDDVHGLARVHVHVEPDAERHRDGVRRHALETGAAQALVERRRHLHGTLPHIVTAGVADRGRFAVAMARRQRLPFEGQQAMPLQIAKGAIVGEHVEAVGRALEGAPGSMPAVRAIADVCAEDARAIVRGHAPGNGHQLIVGQRR